MNYRVFLATALCLLLLNVQIADGSEIRSSISCMNQNCYQDRTAPIYSFSISPITLMDSYYDYFPSGYASHALYSLPESLGGGYIGSYHATPQIYSSRRVYRFKINSTTGNFLSSPAGNININEGFPCPYLDAEEHSFFLAWHGYFDDRLGMNVVLKTDALLSGIPSPYEYLATIFDSPTELYDTVDNEFLWPQISVGPSPIPNKKRLYIMGKNNTSHTLGTCSNVLIAYADFNGADIDNGLGLDFSYSSIPLLNTWNSDTDMHRNPHLSLIAGDNGKLYVAGYHTTATATGDILNEPDIDIFINDNYGAGQWRYLNVSSHIQIQDPGIPTSNFQLKNTSNFNIAKDNLGRLHIPGIWACSDTNGSPYVYHDFLKEIVFDTQTEVTTISDIFPHSENPGVHINPWAQPTTYYNPYCHWDHSLFGMDMKSKLNHQKITNANEFGMMASLWQDTEVPIATTPRINISISGDNGNQWSDPIVLNPLSTPELQGQIPMYVYPSDQIKHSGFHNGYAIGKLGLMYIDDLTWGPQSISSDAPPIDGATIKFSEIKIQFPNAGSGNCILNLHVQDSNGNPIPDAEVSLGNEIFLTQTSGNLSIENLCPGTWDLQISEPEYNTYASVIDFGDSLNIYRTIVLEPTSGADQPTPPLSLGIQQIYPNPFYTTTNIQCSLPEKGALDLSVYNIKGQRVKTLYNGFAESGIHNLSWDGNSDDGQVLPSGIYFVRYQSGIHTQNMKLIMVK